MAKLRKYVLNCALCQISNDPIGVSFEVSGMTQGEVWDHITEPANARGWDVRLDSESNQRFFVCPGCLVKERDAKHNDDNPSEFCEAGKCPKCSHGEVETLYCGGARFAQDIYREPEKDWLQRKCKRCKYTWKESCLDRHEQKGIEDVQLPRSVDQPQSTGDNPLM